MPACCAPPYNFYPRSPCGERQRPYYPQSRPRLFLSTLSLRRATYTAIVKHLLLKISIHALLAESDGGRSRQRRDLLRFLSTLSLRRATYSSDGVGGLSDISIHALLAESDVGAVVKLQCIPDFYPRSPCGERRALACSVGSGCLFLSTLSLRRATGCLTMIGGFGVDFYPRSPCGERLFSCFWCILNLYISIHALLAESDTMGVTVLGIQHHFYPRSPCGERLPINVMSVSAVQISIHALLAESDIDSSRAASFQHHFYPRSPCGERHPAKSESLTTYFISIHALLAESDISTLYNILKLLTISIHALLAESDRQNTQT